MVRCMMAAAALLLVSCNKADLEPVGAKPAAAAERSWRSLPLIRDGKVDSAWFHTGYGTFTVDDGALRTDCDEKGLGLLVYGKEKLGDCQIRVVYRSKDPRSNAGVYIRIDDGILQTKGEKPAPASRENGKLTDEGLTAMKEASEKDLGPWYAVHHGYEVQIAVGGDECHRTGAVYALAPSSLTPSPSAPGTWRTMVITLRGNVVEVEVDGQRSTTFDPASPDVPARKVWHEPDRTHPRPTHGYIGLQNHDPGDTVWFKEVSVKPLKTGA